MGDLLSAASVLLAVVAILYGLWYPQIEAALAVKPAVHKADRGEARRTVQETVVHRALPLTIFSATIALIFLPDATKIVIRSVTHTFRNGFSALRDYDAVTSSLVVVTLVLCGLAAYLGVQTNRMRQKLREIDRP